MSAPVKLTAFAAALAVVFGGAVAVGDAIGPVPDLPATADADADAGMTAMADQEGAHGAAVQEVRGLAVTNDGLTLQLASSTARAGTTSPLSFRITGRDGRTVRDFDVEHTKRMHLIVVRRDLTGFQHLHPAQRADGSWTVPLRLRDAGTYRVLADFSHDGKPQTLADDLQVDGTVRSQALPAPVARTTVDGLDVRLTEGASHAGEESELAFALTRRGKAVPVQNYLGAKGHLVALREGDLAFLHVHPDAGRLRFMATFPSAGRYRLFLQFQVDGRVRTAAFTQEVAR
jgi:hypothetical protein